MSSSSTAPALAGDQRLPALDGLRGLAVMLVLLDHASDAKLRIFPAADMNRAGKYGVYLFFVLSAFLLTHLLLLRPPAELSRARTWLNYAVRRFFRIFPLYAVVLVVLVVIHKLKVHDLWTHLLLQDGRRQFWTIPVEVKYYFVLPFIVLAISWLGRREWLRGLLATVGAIAVGAGIFYGEAHWSLTTAIDLSRLYEPFLLGTAAALLHRVMVRRAAGVARFAPVLEVLAFAALAVTLLRIPSIYNAVFASNHPIHKFGYDPIICGVLWTVLLLGMLHGTGVMRRVLECAPARYLGLISYSVYLWHVKFLSDVDNMPVPHPVRLLIFIALVVAVASVSYYLIERPLSRLRFDGKRLAAKAPTLPALAPTAPVV